MIIDALRSATRRVAGIAPNTFFGSTEALQGEMCDLVNEAAADIIASHDWQALTVVGTISPDGSTSYPRPADYSRMALVSDVHRENSYFWGYYHAATANEFLALQEQVIDGFPGAWTMMGNRFHFTPAPVSEGRYLYISKNYATSQSGTVVKSSFDADTDEFVLPERLLTLWLVWRWKEQKELAFTGDQEAFHKAISEESGKDRGSRVIRKGGGSRVPRAYPAWSGTIGPVF